MIDSFTGEHAFLSNFYESPIVMPDWHPARGETAFTVEHAFQAAKTTDELKARHIIAAYSPRAAKRLGRIAVLRDGWDKGRVQIMYGLLIVKFAPESDLSVKLLETNYEELVEGNTWGDYFWGKVDGCGSNMLGRLLMLVRAELDVWFTGAKTLETA